MCGGNRSHRIAHRSHVYYVGFHGLRMFPDICLLLSIESLGKAAQESPSSGPSCLSLPIFSKNVPI